MTTPFKILNPNNIPFFLGILEIIVKDFVSIYELNFKELKTNNSSKFRKEPAGTKVYSGKGQRIKKSIYMYMCISPSPGFIGEI